MDIDVKKASGIWTIEGMEPAAVPPTSGSCLEVWQVAQISIAISLKRLADAENFKLTSNRPGFFLTEQVRELANLAGQAFKRGMDNA